MTTEIKLKEYEILSEDRRRAVEIFMRGLVIVIAVYGIGLKVLLDQTTLFNVLIIGVIGIIISPFGMIYGKYCKNHNKKLQENLMALSKDLRLIPTISTNYIFNAIYIGGTILILFWIGTFIALKCQKHHIQTG